MGSIQADATLSQSGYWQWKALPGVFVRGGDNVATGFQGTEVNLTCHAASVFRALMILSAATALGLPATAARAELTNEGLLGLGLRMRPAYDGSDSNVIEPVPVVRYFGHPWFVRSTQGVLEGGARVEVTPGLNVGAQLAYESGRKAGDSGFLSNRGLPDVNPGASLGVHAEWDHNFGPMPVTLLARLRQQTQSSRGAQADLRLSAGAFQAGRFGAGVFVQATWADAKSTGAIYNVTPQQSATAGLPAFSAGGGLLYTSIGALWGLELSKEWMVLGNIEQRRLRGDAAGSPLTERTSGNYVSAGIAYRY